MVAFRLGIVSLFLAKTPTVFVAVWWRGPWGDVSLIDHCAFVPAFSILLLLHGIRAVSISLLHETIP